jgi:hypothetical protein
MDSPAFVGPGGAASKSPTSPLSFRSIGANGGLKRKRSTGGVVSAIESSPGSIGDENDIGDHHDRKRQPGVKRACNECRQQKVSHAVSPTTKPIVEALRTLPDPSLNFIIPRLQEQIANGIVLEPIVTL